MSNCPLPPDNLREWIDDAAAQLRDALAIPQVRSRLLELLLGERRDDDENDTGA
jgi:hypothetical protein